LLAEFAEVAGDSAFVVFGQTEVLRLLKPTDQIAILEKIAREPAVPTTPLELRDGAVSRLREAMRVDLGNPRLSAILAAGLPTSRSKGRATQIKPDSRKATRIS
jgi:hypothetical protein